MEAATYGLVAWFRGEKDIIPPSEGGVLGSNPDGTAIKLLEIAQTKSPTLVKGRAFCF